MKSLLKIAILALIIGGCSNNDEFSKDLPGTYTLSRQRVQQGANTASYNDLEQLKIFTNSHFMFTQIDPVDSSVLFRVGSYTLDGDTLREHCMYGSDATTAGYMPEDFNWEITHTPGGFDQAMNNLQVGQTNSKLTESFFQEDNSSTTPIDGIWEETKSYTIHKNDSIPDPEIRYEAFYKGYFMVGKTDNAGVNTSTSEVSYGAFKLLHNGEVEETEFNSSKPFTAGSHLDILFDISDKDHYVQRMKNPNGSIRVEYFKRIG